MPDNFILRTTRPVFRREVWVSAEGGGLTRAVVEGDGFEELRLVLDSGKIICGKFGMVPTTECGHDMTTFIFRGGQRDVVLWQLPLSGGGVERLG